MKLRFCLLQAKDPRDHKKGIQNYFKFDPCHILFLHYFDRIKHYRTVEAFGQSFESFQKMTLTEQNVKILCCDIGPHVKNPSSEALSEKIANWENGGVSSIVIALGPANGFSSEERAQLKKQQAFFWGLGAQTLPHDLAAVIASEQIYRAYTILKNEPYHLGH